MAIDPRLSLGTQPLNIQQAIQGGLATAQQIRQAPIQEALLRQKQQAGAMQLQQARAQQAQTQGLLANQVFSQLSQVPMSQRSTLLAQNADRLRRMGIDPTQIDITDQGVQRGLAATQIFAPQQKPQFFELSRDETLVQAGPGGVQTVAQGIQTPDESSQKAKEELRNELRGNVGDLRKQASTLKTNYNKLLGLADEMRKGNRSAVSQGLVALVKLGDPTSVVREAEMEAALNKQNPLAAVTQLLQGKNTSQGVINSVVSKIDPLSPENVKVDEILATGNAMMLPNVEALNQQFSIAEQRGASQLTSDELATIIGDPTRELFRELTNLSQTIAQPPQPETTQTQAQQTQPQGQPAQQQQPQNEVVMQHPTLGDITEKHIQETMRIHGVTRQQVFEQLMQGAQ